MRESDDFTTTGGTFMHHPDEREACPVPGIPEFWDRVRSAERRFLALDYDGTLAPFHQDRMKAFPLEGVRESILKISRDPYTSLTIVSGRPVEELLELLKPVEVTMVGSHGWEIWTPDGVHRLMPPAPRQDQRLDGAQREAAELGAGDRTERKLASLAVHTRGMAGEAAEELERNLVRLWSNDVPRYGLECRRFNGGVELRSKGIDKGRILRELLIEEPEGVLCVYVGDDETDEDAFGEVRERGFGIKIGKDPVPTKATGRLPDCRAVVDFLREWIRVTIAEGE